jgi:hypothetical protein
MDKTTKTILIVVGSLVVLCGCVVAAMLGTGVWSFNKLVQFAEKNTTEDPQKVAQIASEIADFDVPQGFGPRYAMKIATFSLAQYTTNSESSYLFLTQFPAGTSIKPDQMMREIKDGARDPNSAWHNVDMALVEQKPIVIRGQETTLSISEGKNDQGMLYRMANATFQGKGEGPSLLMVVAPADQWDAQMLEDFIASIR